MGQRRRGTGVTNPGLAKLESGGSGAVKGRRGVQIGMSVPPSLLINRLGTNLLAAGAVCLRKGFFLRINNADPNTSWVVCAFVKMILTTSATASCPSQSIVS